MNILADATLLGLQAAFPAPFHLRTYTEAKDIPLLLKDQDVLLCRSSLKVDATLLKNHPLKYLATASSGTDHIDCSYLQAQNIQLIDAKGSNAHSVADYVTACIAYLQDKSLFSGNRIGIMGMGKVGSQIYSLLKGYGFELWVFDPLKAEKDADFNSCTKEDLVQCDLLCIHAELHDEAPHATRQLIDASFLARLKPGCILLNAARGGIVDETALLETQQTLIYCTDVYQNEPHIDSRIVDKALLCTPHIAGHSLEAKYAAVAMVSEQLHHALKLRPPKYAVPTKPQRIDLQQPSSWQRQILSLYNPEQESLFLKQAKDKESAFLYLRKNHRRHDLV